MKKKISADKIYFGYRGTQKEKVLKDITFSAEEGEVFCILGPNGTGKSTLLKCLSGILRPDSGSISLDGENIHSMDAPALARKMAYVPQSHTSVFPFTVHDVVLMGRTPYLSVVSSPTREDHEKAEKAMDSVGISHLAGRPCTEISGGEWQLVLIARALTQQPEIILLDEPTSHLDLGNQMRILNIISSLAGSGITIIMASHFPDHALLGASKAAILKDHMFTALGAPEDIITEKTMHETYGVNVRILNLGDSIGRKVCIPVLDEKNVTLPWN